MNSEEARAYLDLERLASTVAIRLERVATGNLWENDEERLKSASDVLHRILTDPLGFVGDSHSVRGMAFVNPQGLCMLPLPDVEGQTLSEMSDELREIVEEMQSESSSKRSEQDDKVSKSSKKFRLLASEAENRAALIENGLVKLDYGLTSLES